MTLGRNLLLDGVCAAEHVIHVGEVVCAGEQGIGVTAGGIVLLEVGSLPQGAHLLCKSQSRDRINNIKGASKKRTSS